MNKLNEEKIFYVYVYLDPRYPGEYYFNNKYFAYKPFYVGKGKNTRFYDHIKNLGTETNAIKKNKISKIIRETCAEPIIEFIETGLNEEDAYSLEAKAVEFWGRIVNKTGILTNSHPGGIQSPCLYGEDNGFYKKKHSKESIDKMQKGVKETHRKRGYGRSTIDLIINDKRFYSFGRAEKDLKMTRAKIKLMCGNPEEILTYCLDPTLQNKFEIDYQKYVEKRIETKKNFSKNASLRLKGKKKSEEHKRRIGEAHKGRDMPWLQETNKNPEKIRKTAEWHRGKKRPQTTRNKISEAGKKYRQSLVEIFGEPMPSNFKGIYITPKGKFLSLPAASKAFGLSNGAIYQRCKSHNKNWSSYGWGFEPCTREYLLANPDTFRI